MRPVPVFAAVKLLRHFVNHKSGDHFYSTHPETENLGDYLEETPLGYVFIEPEYTLTPLFRWYHPAAALHWFTTDPQARLAGYVSEGIAGYVFKPDAAPRDATRLYRWLRRRDGSHILTASGTAPAPEYVADPSVETGSLYPYSAARWMERLADEHTLRDLTVPGTHDSATYLTSLGDAQCQQLSLERQLDEGVRFIDARLYIPNRGGENTLKFCHGVVTLDLYYDAALNRCAEFLARNPNETLILSIKQEFSGPDFVKPAYYDEKFERLVWQDLESHARGRFYDGRQVPNLQDVRGKIVVLRRFDAPLQAHRGINASGSLWPTNSTTTRPNSDNVTLCIQDEYHYYTSFNVSNKFNKYMSPVLDQARAAADTSTLYINFASGTGAGVPLGESPANIAITTNGLLSQYLRRHPHGRYGIIPLDFPELGFGLPLLTWLISTNPLQAPVYYAE